MLYCQICCIFVRLKFGMVTKNDILCFAANNKQFTRQELIAHLESLNQKVSPNAIWLQLNRLIESNELTRIKRGTYSLSISVGSFTISISKEVKHLNQLLKTQFPFANYCVWDSNSILPYMHHVPNVSHIYVDVERDVMESVFDFISDNSVKRVFLSPGKEEYDRYVIGRAAIIVRPLMTEAPMKVQEGFNTPTIEKILVDVIADIEFSFLQGAEMTYFYANVMERHKINKSKLLRYASRRGRKETANQLFNATL